MQEEILNQAKEKLREEYEYAGWINKLSEYTEDYKCAEDCKQSGCPGHTAKFHLGHVTDTYNIEFHNKDIYLDPVQLGLILDFAERLSERHIRLISQSLSKYQEKVLEVLEGMKYPLEHSDDCEFQREGCDCGYMERLGRFRALEEAKQKITLITEGEKK